MSPVGRRGGVVALLVVAIVVLLGDTLEREGGDERDPAAEPGESVRAEVLRVIDGDTIEVLLDGREEDVRYIGIDTPESVKPGAPVECFGRQAANANRELVEGERVRLRFDRERRDRFGRLLAYVYANGELVNAQLVANGFARTLEIEPNTAMAEELSRLERTASLVGLGLWLSC